MNDLWHPARHEPGANPPMWEHQQAAIVQIDAALDEGETRIVVKIPTGGGKTRLASEFI